MRTRLGKGSEFDLIRGFLRSGGTLPPEIVVGPGDDCAVLDDGLVVSVDISLEGIHFRQEWITLQEAGYRAAVAGLSDLAAMAAEPLGLLVSLAVGSKAPEEAARQLNAGVVEAAGDAGVQILGGDLSSSPGPAVVDIVALGRTERPLLRSGSRPGDDVWVTGWLGGSGAAVAAWMRGETPGPGLRSAFCRPTPRIREARWLAERVTLHSGIDLSDGLAGDAGHLAAASGVALILDLERLPFSPDLVSHRIEKEERLRFALQGGEDYELCLTAPEGVLRPLCSPFQQEFGIPLSRVGRVAAGEGVAVEDALGFEGFESGGFSHFRGGEKG